MSLHIGDNFKYQGKKFLDARESFKTLAEMRGYDSVPDGFITYCIEDGTRYEYNSANPIDPVTGKWSMLVLNGVVEGGGDSGGSVDYDDIFYIGDNPESTDPLWFSFNGSDAQGLTYDNPLINELFACIKTLQDQVVKLQADVEYLKINGGGGGGITPKPPKPDEDDKEEISVLSLLLEDGASFELEEGGLLILEESGESIVVTESILVLEDGSALLLEDGSSFLLEASEIVKPNEDKTPSLLMENGAILLTEQGNRFILE